MAKNRMINTRFWSDTYISSVDPLEKLLFLYFITNQYTNICGIYEIPIKQIALDTGIDRDNLEKVFLPRLRQSNKIYYIDGWVYVKNFQKHQKTSGNVKEGIENGLKDVPRDIMAKIKDILDTPPYDQDTAHNLNPNPNLTKPEPKLKIADKSAEESFTPNDYDYFLKSNQRHIQIIGLYAKHRELNIPTLEEAKGVIKRHSKPAAALKDCSDQQLEDTFCYLDSVVINGRVQPWTLEAVARHIDTFK